ARGRANCTSPTPTRSPRRPSRATSPNGCRAWSWPAPELRQRSPDLDLEGARAADIAGGGAGAAGVRVRQGLGPEMEIPVSGPPVHRQRDPATRLRLPAAIARAVGLEMPRPRQPHLVAR